MAAIPGAGGFSSSSHSLPDLGGQPVVVAVEDDYPPFNFVPPKSGNPVGWDYDALREIGRRLNFHPEFKEIAWDSMIQGVSTGQFDVAANGITFTPERAIAVDFSTSYSEVHQRLLVRKSEKRFEMLKYFVTTPGAKLGAQNGNTNYTRAVDLVGRSRVVAYDSFGDLVQALLTGDLDAVIIDDVGGQGYVGANANKLRLLYGKLPGQALAMIFTRGSPLRDSFNKALAQMRLDGTLNRLNSRWFSSSFRVDKYSKP